MLRDDENFPMEESLSTLKRVTLTTARLIESMIVGRKEAVWLRQELQRVKKQLNSNQQHLQQSRQLMKKANQQNQQMKSRLRELNLRSRQIARDYLLSLMPKGSVCAEIGVHEGEFSRQIYGVVRPRKLHLIDPWQMGEGLFGDQEVNSQADIEEKYNQVKGQFVDQLESGNVEIHRALSDEAAPQFDDAYFDWVYIDGNHEYKYVKHDLDLYFPKVKAGGYLTGDDYGNVGYWENGIQKAVDEFVSEHPSCSLEVKASQFIIQKPLE